MAKMARCSVCQGVIRKAEVVHAYALGFLHAPLVRTTVHAECMSKNPAAFVEEGATVESVAVALEAWGRRQVESRRREQETGEQRHGALSDELCWLRLETDRHPQHRCSPRCPVPYARCSHVYNVADDGEFREHNEMTDYVSCGRREAPQPLCLAYCNHMWC